MKTLDLRYYLFHAIGSIYQADDSKTADYNRLKCFLETGYIFPGKDVKSQIPIEYQNKFYVNDRGSPYVHLALTDNTIVSQSITSRSSEFSAFSEEIADKMAFMFDENVLKGQELAFKSCMLNNEVLLSTKVSLTLARAIYYPKDFPFEYIKRYLTNLRETDPIIKEICKKENEKLTQELLLLLNQPELVITEQYQEVERITKILLEHKFDIPIVNAKGRILDKQEELNYITNNYQKIKSLIKK